jgi:hypothetical protein
MNGRVLSKAYKRVKAKESARKNDTKLVLWTLAAKFTMTGGSSPPLSFPSEPF